MSRRSPLLRQQRGVSLRARLLLAVGAAAVLALVAADVATWSALHSFLYQRVDQSLVASEAPLLRAVDQGRTFLAPPRFGPGPGGYVEVRSATGLVIDKRPAMDADGEETILLDLPKVITGFKAGRGPYLERFLTVSDTHGDADYRALAIQLPNGEQVVSGVPLDDTEATLDRLVGIEVAVTSLALLGALGLGWWLVRLGLRPLVEVETTADAIADGELDRRVPGAEQRTEVGRLARALNTMLGRIQDAFAERDATETELRRSEERMRRFVADASHELRTPVAAVSAYAELFERGARSHPEDLPRLMAGIRVETARMGELVQDLLLLARLDEGRPVAAEPVELVRIAADAVAASMAVGPDWPVHLEAAHPVEVVGDAGRLRQVLDNLLVNARHHTPAGTGVVVRIGEEGGQAVLAVADRGPGLTDEQAARVFERFYRTDPSRSRQAGGAGLGLAIVSAIVAGHHGTVAVAGGPDGATFTVRLPVAPAAAAAVDQAPPVPTGVG